VNFQQGSILDILGIFWTLNINS